MKRFIRNTLELLDAPLHFQSDGYPLESQMTRFKWLGSSLKNWWSKFDHINYLHSQPTLSLCPWRHWRSHSRQALLLFEMVWSTAPDTVLHSATDTISLIASSQILSVLSFQFYRSLSYSFGSTLKLEMIQPLDSNGVGDALSLTTGCNRIFIFILKPLSSSNAHINALNWTIHCIVFTARY